MARIMIVEDDAHILRLLSLWLTRNGHEVLEASNGTNAQEALIQTPVDLVVSDVNMPGVNGIELVRWYRGTLGQTSPVIMLSSRCDQDVIAAQLAGEDVRIHPKPFSPSRLVAMINELLRGGRLAAAGESGDRVGRE
jgi:DNA-binding response OmpR family regulator